MSGGPWPGNTVSGGSSPSSSIKPARVSRYAAGEVAKGNSTDDKSVADDEEPELTKPEAGAIGGMATSGNVSTTNSPSATAEPPENVVSTRGDPEETKPYASTARWMA